MASIKKNFIYNIVINVSAVIFPLITAPYIARVLEPNGIGLMNFANTYAGYYSMFAVLGAATYGIREIAKRRDSHEAKQQFFSEILTVLLINTIVVSSIFIATLLIFPKFNANFLIFFIAGFTIYFVPFGCNWYLSGLEKFGFIAGRNLLIRALAIICMFLFVKTKSDLYIYMILGVISQLGGILWNFSIIKKDNIKIRLCFKSLGKHYKPMLILFSSSVAISVYTMLDTIMLGFMKNYEEVGFYNSSINIAKTALSIVTSLSAVAIPRVSYYMERKDQKAISDLLSKSFFIVSILAFPMAVGLACIAPNFVPLFLGKAFYPSILPLIIVSGIIIAIGFNNITGMQTLLGMGYDKPYLYCLLIGTFLNFAMNLLLIPQYGAVGAAFSSVVAEFAILAAMVYAIRKYTQIRFKGVLGDIWKSLLASIFFIPITILLSKILEGWTLVIADIITCIIIYCFLQWILASHGFTMITANIRILQQKICNKK